MCSYKLVTVKFEVWGLQTRVEQFVHKVREQTALPGPWTKSLTCHQNCRCMQMHRAEPAQVTAARKMLVWFVLNSWGE